VGFNVGSTDGNAIGCFDGDKDGICEGSVVGDEIGCLEGF